MCLRTPDVTCNSDFMPRRSRSAPLAAASPDDARERILAAAQRCIDRHGIRKTTWSPHMKAQEPRSFFIHQRLERYEIACPTPLMDIDSYPRIVPCYGQSDAIAAQPRKPLVVSSSGDEE